MANAFVTLNGAVLYPELPIGREFVTIHDDRRMRNGQLRRARFAEAYRFTLRLSDATEAERAAWLAAAPMSASLTFTDELGAARSVLVVAWRDDLVRTEPAVEGGLSTTGPAYYDLEVVLEGV